MIFILPRSYGGGGAKRGGGGLIAPSASLTLGTSPVSAGRITL